MYLNMLGINSCWLRTLIFARTYLYPAKELEGSLADLQREAESSSSSKGCMFEERCRFRALQAAAEGRKDREPSCVADQVR